jgi:hypothetical protein
VTAAPNFVTVVRDWNTLTAAEQDESIKENKGDSYFK